MPPHSSHLLQPLDVGCFSPLKRAYSRQVEGLMRCHITHIEKEDFLPAFTAAYDAAITPDNIKGGIRGSGLVPHDPDSVISKLDVVVRTLSLSPALPAVWVSQTPRTAPQMASQADYMRDRIRRHKSSSPTSIIEGFNSMTKVA